MVEEIVKHTARINPQTHWTESLSRFQFGALDYFIRQAEVDSLDYFKQSVLKIADLNLFLKHFKLKGRCIVASTISKHLLHLTTPHQAVPEMLDIPL